MPRKETSSRDAFMDHLFHIRGRLCVGNSMVSIHEDFKERLGISYSQFVRYVHRFVWSKRGDSTESNKKNG